MGITGYDNNNYIGSDAVVLAFEAVVQMLEQKLNFTLGYKDKLVGAPGFSIRVVTMSPRAC